MSGGFKGGDFAKIFIHDVQVHVAVNEHGHTRGLHIVIINPGNGKVMFAKVFDTYKRSDTFDAFVAKGVPDGYIVVAACKDECTRNLSTDAKSWFAKMGSKEIFSLSYRQGFGFIGTAGKKDAHEKRCVDSDCTSVT